MRLHRRSRSLLTRPLLAAWLAGGATTAALDLLWLGVAAKDFYRGRLGHLMADEPCWPAAAAFYALYASGVLFFAAAPALKTGSPRQALALGAALGLLVYGTYDLTNMAVLKNWSGLIGAVDVAWGTFLTAAAAAAAYGAGRLIAS